MEKNYNKLYFFLILFFFGSKINFAQTDQELWVKLSPELRMNIENTPFEFRWRPVDVIYLPEEYVPSGRVARTDLMLGITNKYFKLFSYSKFNETGEIWTGFRFDQNIDFFDKKLLINIQERYFWGVNEKSKTHYYLVQYIRYRVVTKVLVGVLAYGNWKIDKSFSDGSWFVGPSVDYEINKAFNLHLALTKDVFHTQSNMLYTRLGYRFNLGKKE